MAPRKEPKEPRENAADMILTYLRKQNRPYSATDISANLHNKVTKAATAKLLKDLHERKEIEGRAAGKQIVYHSVQSADDGASPEDLAAIDAQINTYRFQTSDLQASIKVLKGRLYTLSSTMSTVDLVATMASLDAERAEILARLSPLRAGSVKPVDTAEMKHVDAELNKWTGIEVRRRKIEAEMWALMRDLLPEGTDHAELREKLGLDE
ncbi:homologous-pairing protein-like protein 2 [Pseudovirgaria hyperparasitica]|uniref:Homologous-pairing protein-like protein 2 n=1 Tax=Pseudovirgaria hyperparasitica TaxID=470096 RepID=A0A6A6W898_9PEZI|nr:homologous-pairing protein-like protein 2 [Pseudovirgaria hyperparasitica]KAF2758180.1 homologous-pairing protein-like protein 2 [Pseudovirgaria hyperparasitica]